MILVDAHCHLEPQNFPEPVHVIARAREAGVVHIIVVGLLQQSGDFGHALNIARAHPGFLTPTMGIHPHDSAMATRRDWEELEKLCGLPEVRAIGEAGLDFYYNHSPCHLQTQAFRYQCQLANQFKKPLVVHVRDAHRECADILEAEGIRTGMIHCFTGDVGAARRYLDLGFYVSISGIITYKKTEPLQAAVAYMPLDRMLVETDSPYLTPAPYRGHSPNEPRFVAETAKKVAQLHNKDADEVAFSCAHNAAALLGFDLPV